MTRIRGRLTKEQLPSGQDGSVLTHDTSVPGGLVWRPKTDRLVTDLSPELSGDLDAAGYKVTGLGAPTDTDDAATKTYVDSTVAAGGLEKSYLFANKTFTSLAYAGLSRGVDHWVTPTGWTLNVNDEWSESSGEFTYGGAYPAGGTRYFAVNWCFDMLGYADATYWKMLGRLTIDTDSGHVKVPGSQQGGDYFSWMSFFGLYLQRHNVCGTAIVAMSNGDKLSFQYGYHISGAGTANIGSLYTQDDGIQMTITPVDVT